MVPVSFPACSLYLEGFSFMLSLNRLIVCLELEVVLLNMKQQEEYAMSLWQLGME